MMKCFVHALRSLCFVSALLFCSACDLAVVDCLAFGGLGGGIKLVEPAESQVELQVGAELRLKAQGCSGVTWSASGGELRDLGAAFGYYHAVFVASESGDYLIKVSDGPDYSSEEFTVKVLP